MRGKQWLSTVSLCRFLVALFSAMLLAGPVPAGAQPGCPDRIMPPPPVDSSEVPAPGTALPAPMPVPEQPVGGPRMGECGLVLPDGAPPPPAGISAMSWLLADVDSGEVLAAWDPHARHRPASTIKLLTALVVADELPPDRVVVATQADADQEGSRVGLGPGGRYTVRQLLLGLLLVSGNDAAHALAEQLGGTGVTVQKMNQLAARLGARDTRAATPSGLDGPGMSASAYDLALVFRQVLHRPLLAELLATQQAEFPGYDGRPGFVVSNDNKLLRSYPGALGGKTGFTDDARHTQVDAAQRGGRRLMVVLMRGEQRPVPMAEQAARLLDYGFSLPLARPVGRLVNEGELPETLPGPDAVVPSSPPAEVHAASHGASKPAAVATSPLLVLLWVAVGAGAAVALVTMLARRRHR